MTTKMKAGQIPGEEDLTIIRDELHGGLWDRMLKDLRDRLNQRPYIFKLFKRIREDIATIEVIVARGKT